MTAPAQGVALALSCIAVVALAFAGWSWWLTCVG